MTPPIRLTAGLLGFEHDNCQTCQHPCALDASSANMGVNADELNTIAQGVCPYHPAHPLLPRARHQSLTIDYTRHAVRDGITLVQRIVRVLSGGVSA